MKHNQKVAVVQTKKEGEKEAQSNFFFWNKVLSRAGHCVSLLFIEKNVFLEDRFFAFECWIITFWGKSNLGNESKERRNFVLLIFICYITTSIYIIFPSSSIDQLLYNVYHK